MASDEETEDTRVKKKPQLHETHCDPCGDVTLISNDDVEFRASSFQLSKISQFFAYAFRLPAPADKGREPIELDFPGNIITIYLDLVTAPVRLRRSVLDHGLRRPEIVCPLWALVEFTLCIDEITSIIHSALMDAALYYPVGILTFASERDDISLARRALRSFNTTISICSPCRPSCVDEHASQLEDVKKVFTQLKPEYQAELFTLLLLQCHTRASIYNSPGPISPDDLIFGFGDWGEIADRFDPSKPMKSKMPLEETEPETEIEEEEDEEDEGDEEDEEVGK
ncbi:hypothetical protein I302_106027 [Kwoniella bestiolae CBS 10118]|uniref:BTB domain-containing protein n=1 Tax=Kwoniella bestiolae CBS 10118 TaxID=1296100 RepID=A0A1B9G2U4_9TREE|nr:hypothetical protein I302_05151 [Kwoniella bestiolae CBS 10118]OCF25335.1 hypothetical protein I302_05151 [Kwoniella bestiolae CBS 10118]